MEFQGMQAIKHTEHLDWIIYPEIGKVVDEKTNKTLGSVSSSTGYVYITSGKHTAVHRLIYEAVHDVKLTKEEQINHINWIKTDNRITNLEVVNNSNNARWSVNRTGNWKGVCFVEDRGKWKAELKFNYENTHLGYYDTELEGAKAYNDYAKFLNDNPENNCNYYLNPIPGYVTVARNVPEENKQRIAQQVTSTYNGVSYDAKRKYFVVSIKHKEKSYHLGHSNNEVELAKLYNQQSLYFNNHDGGQYTLNVIPDYVTVEKNIFDELQANKKARKSSKYYGVNKRDDKYKALLVFDKKQIHLGTYKTQEEAARVYNTKAQELNEKFNKKYKINVIEEDE